MGKVNSLGNRLIALTLSIVMVLGMFPSGVVAVNNSVAYGVVESLTDGVTINETGKDIKVSFAGDLTWVAADTTVGRNSDGWWIGLKVTAPETISIDTAKYTSGGQEKLFKEYNDSEDDAEVQFIQLWSMVKEEYLRSANLTDGLSTYTWSFDWDGNGEYEQTMTLDIDADQTILYKDGSTQVYPAESLGYGKLDMLTAGAAVVGNESANISASYENELTVDWVAADTSVGRYQDGWWAGMKITVPAGMTEEQLKNAQYMSGETVKSFWTYKDSQEGDAVHFMTMWVPLNNLLTGNMKPYEYKFDWNNDGIFEQSVTMKVDPTKVTLTKDDVQVYPKLGTLTSLSGGNVTGSETGNATLLIEKAELTWSAADKDAGREQDGWWVGAKVTAPEGTDLAKVKFRRKTGADSWTDPMDYKPDEGSTMQLWGLITGEYLKTFEAQNRDLNYVWQFDWNGDGKFEQTVTMTVVPKDIILKQEDFAFVQKEETIVFAEDLVYQITAPVGNLSGEAPVYTVTNEPGKLVAELDETGTGLRILGAGKVTVTATVNKYFNPVSASFELIIDKGNQNTENFFAKGEKPEVTFEEGATFENAVIGGSGDGAVTYEIVQQMDLEGSALKEGETVVSAVEGSNGVYQILRSGIVTVEAKKAESANYKEAVYYYTLTVKRADQSFSVADDKVYYGVAEYTPDLEHNLQVTSEGFGTGAYTLMVKENTVGASVEGDRIVFNAAADKTGKVEIVVTKLADACYNKFSKSFVLTVEYVQAPAYKLVDDQGKEVKPNANGWYNAQVYVQPAEEGWLVSDDNIRGNEVWSEDLPYGGEGSQTEAKFAFLRESDRAMTELLSVETYRRDDTVPTKLEINYDTDLTWPEALGKLFGFKKDTTSVTIKAEDALSGVAFLYYSIDGGKNVDQRNNIAFNGQNVAEYTFEIPAQYRDSIVFWAVDMADNTSQYSDGKTLVVDAITPEITVKYDEENTVKDAAGDIYAKGALELTFELKADNTDLAKTIRLTVNGNEEELNWTSTSMENVQAATCLLPVNGDYEIAFLYEDYLERTADKTLTVHTDDKLPVVDVTFDPAKGNDNGLYFKEDRVATIKITEHNFDATKVKAVVTAENILGEAVEAAEVTEITATLSDPDSWDSVEGEEDTYVAQVTFATDAHYTFTVDCEDIAGNAADPYVAEPFVVDHDAPVDLKIEYSEPTVSFWQNLAKTITFGAYNPEKNAPLIVTITATDITSGVDYFEWFYTREAGASETNADTGSVELLDATPTDEGASVFSASFEIAPQARGYITFRATDYAGNTYGVDEDTGTEDQWVEDSARINIVDTIAPGRTVTFTPEVIYDAQTMTPVESFTERDDVILYYREEALVTIDIEEANFYSEDVVVAVTKDGEEYSVDVAWYSADADNHQGTFFLDGDGDYIVTVNYMDRSLNEMVKYTSQEVHIDNTVPVIGVTYEPEEGNDNGLYFKEDRVATINITEHNFDATKVKAVVTAGNILGEAVEAAEVTEINAILSNPASWTEVEADVYEAQVTFATDAHYTFTVDCEDIAGNAADPYVAEPFVVDHNAPADLTIEYDANLTWPEALGKLFGFKKDTTSVTIKAEDAISGVAFLYYSIDGGKTVDQRNNIAFNGQNVAEHTFEIPAQYRDSIAFWAVDMADNTSQYSDGKTLVVDAITPEITVKYDEENTVKDATGDIYAKGALELTFELKADNTDLAKTIRLTVNGNEEDLNWTPTSVENVQSATYLLPVNGDYEIAFLYEDYLERTADKTLTVHTDDKLPVIDVTFDPAKGNDNGLYFKEDRVATIKITEHNFDATKVKAVVTAGNILGEAVEAAEVTEITATLSDPDSWDSVEGEEDTYVAQVTFATDARYTFTVDCEDIAGNSAETYVADGFVVDHEAPVDLSISYSKPLNTWYEEVLETITFGAYNPNADAPLIVTLTATDVISGVDYFEWFYTREEGASETNADSMDKADAPKLVAEVVNGAVYSATFTVEPEARGFITYRATDRAGNTYGVDNDDATADEWVEASNTVNIVDTIAPNRTVTWEETVVYDAHMTPVDEFVEGDNVIIYYKDKAQVTIDVEEANFYSEDVKVVVTTDPKNEEIGKDYSTQVSWTSTDADNHQGIFTVEETDGDYYLVISYMDRSLNEMVTYTSQPVHFDTTAPEMEVTYAPEEGNVNGLYFKEDRVATIVVTEHNFDATKVTAAVELKDITGADIEADLEDSAKFAAEMTEYLRNDANWKYMDAEGNIIDTPENAVPDVRVAQYTFNQDAHYTFTVDCKDIIGNEAKTYTAEPFVVDHEAPVIDPQTDITYSTPVNTVWQNILKTITFGAYNPEKNAPLIVTITATDITSGVDYFEWFYTREAGASETNAESGSADAANIQYPAALIENDEDPSVTSVSFEIAPEARGYISFRATDYAGNTYGVDEDTETEDQWVEDSARINIVDTIAPGRVVTLTPNAAYDAETLAEVESIAEGDDVILYYKQDALFTIDVVEANFYSEDVVIAVTKDGEEYPVEVTWTSADADNHQGSFLLTDEGDYYVTVSYTDRSLNEMVTYTSQRIVVDKTLPEVTVEYGNKPEDALNILADKDGNDRQYFFEDQTAVITIEEKNFRADDVKIYVKAQDLLGKNVNVAALTFDEDGNVEQYFAQGANHDEWAKLTDYETNWRREDNTYKLELSYPADANYTFDIVYADMATNEAKDYEPNYFTVDKFAPAPLAAEYSTEGVNVFDNILEGITFGFYDAKMTVTISASDEISGVHRFAYSYIKGEGVSSVNAELLNEAIESAQIKHVEDSYTYTATFEIPKEVLTRDNQFNGTVEFVGFDRSENKSETKTNTNRIIVDNIAPAATISYNTPVKQVGNVSYYAGNVNATIVINEANFYSEDVVVTVNDSPVAVNWSNDSVDVHTGTFTLSSDGDYVVKVSYADRSTNKMEDYTSNQLTIDTKAPVIQVSDVKHESANNGETISFTVQVTDRNIALESFKPTLSVLVKKDNGNNQYSFETETIDLGQARTSVNSNGDTVYTYSVENLEVDGFYSLVCEAVDHANHTVSAINSANNADENTTVEAVNFSVNREGSVFWITTEHTEGDEKIIDQLHGKYVNGEVIVRLHEINVDKVDDGKATIFTLNDGSSAEDIVLDDTNYKKNVSIGVGGWYQTDYTLDNSYFAKDGVYSINIITYDKATNSNVNTKSEEGTITFTVDRTKPVISANLTSKQSIKDTQYKVYFQITELNLDTETIVVKYNGKTVALENLGNNEYSFTVQEGTRQSVQITAVDLAGNESDLYEAKDFTVSTNWFILFYVSDWFWPVVIGVPVLAALIILLILWKKKKKEER